jgi:hypothetical protein
MEKICPSDFNFGVRIATPEREMPAKNFRTTCERELTLMIEKTGQVVSISELNRKSCTLKISVQSASMSGQSRKWRQTASLANDEVEPLIDAHVQVTSSLRFNSTVKLQSGLLDPVLHFRVESYSIRTLQLFLPLSSTLECTNSPCQNQQCEA